MKRERVGIGTEFRDDERHPLGHQASNEGHVTGEAVQLGHDDRTLRLASRGEGGCQLRSAVESVRALAGLDLCKLLQDGDALGFGETSDRCSLRLYAQPGSSLPLRRESRLLRSAAGREAGRGS